MHLTRGTLSSELVKLERDKYINMSKEEKRKLYKCKNDYITLDEILTWPQFYSDEKLNDENTGEENETKNIKKLHLSFIDILRCEYLKE